MGGNPINAIDPYGLWVYGLNLGLGGTFCIKSSYSFQILLDTEGNFAIQKTKEAGIGFGRSVGVFANGLFSNVSNVYDLEQWGGSLSGSFGYFNSAVSYSLSAWGEGEYSVSKLDKCLGIDPAEVIQGPKLNGHVIEYGVGRSVGSKAEGGATVTYTDTLFSSSALGDIGRWLGSKFYDLTHW